jgi:DNA-binding NarL/FixJ family response regulator
LESLGRLRILLAGDAAARPDGLERALTRAGFLVAEATDPAPQAAPDAVLFTLAAADEARLRALLLTEAEESPPRIVAFASEDREAPAAALALGAADALAAPIHLPELCARLTARIRDRQAPLRTGYERRIHASVRELVAESRPLLRAEEVVLTLLRRVARAFDLAHCAFVTLSPGEPTAKVIAALPETAGVPDQLDLARHPELSEAIRSGRPVTVPAVRSLSGGEALADAIAVPAVSSAGAGGVLLLGTHPGAARLAATQLGLAADLAGAAVHALEAAGARSEGRGRNGHRPTAPAESLERRLQEEFERARRYSLSFSLVLLGPEPALEPEPVEDLLRRLRRELRLPDFLARYGAREFAILLPETDVEGARRSVARLRERLGEAVLDAGEAGPSISAGIAGYPHPAVSQPDDLFALVEAALMRGRAQSGERVGVAE